MVVTYHYDIKTNIYFVAASFITLENGSQSSYGKSLYINGQFLHIIGSCFGGLRSLQHDVELLDI